MNSIKPFIFLVFALFVFSNLLAQSSLPDVKDSCGVFTYRNLVQIPNSAPETVGLEVLPGGQYVVGARYEQQGIMRSSLIIFSAAGEKERSVELVNPGREAYVTSIGYRQGHGIFAGGNFFNNQPFENIPFISKWNLDGTLQWCVSPMPQVESLQDRWDVKLFATLDGGVVYTYKTEEVLIVGRLSATGGIMWTNEIKEGGFIRDYMIAVNGNNRFVIALNTLIQTRATAFLIEGNTANGNILNLARLGNDDPQVDYYISDVTANFSSFRVCGTDWNRNVNGIFFDFHYLGNGRTANFQTISSSALTLNTSSIVAKIDPASGAMALTSLSVWQGILSGGVFANPLFNKNRMLPLVLGLTAGFRQAPDGGYLWLINTTGIGAFMVIKTDSTLAIGNCETNTPDIRVRDSILNFPTITPWDNKPVAISAKSIPIQAKDFDVNIVRECFSNQCTKPPPLPDCVNGFNRQYNFYAPNSLFARMALNQKNEPLVYFNSLSNFAEDPSGAQYDRGLVKMSARGDVEKSGIASIENTGAVPIPFKANNGGYFVVHDAMDNPSTNKQFIYFSFYNDAMQHVWGRKIELPEFARFGTGEIKLTQDEAGDIYLSVLSSQFTISSYIFLYKFRANGNAVWQRYISTNSLLTVAPEIVVSGGKVFITALDYEPRALRLLRFNAANGNLEFMKHLSVNGFHLNASRHGLFVHDNALFFVGDATGLGNADGPMDVLLKTDFEGNVIKSVRLPAENYLTKADMRFGKLSLFIKRFPTGSYFMYLNDQLEPTLFTAYNGPSDIMVSDVKMGSDTSTMAIYYFPFLNMELPIWSGVLKIPASGFLGDCFTAIPSPVSAPINVTVTNATATSQTAPNNISNTEFQYRPFSVNAAANLCIIEDNCDMLSLEGPTTICDTTSTYTYRFSKNASCTQKPRFQFHPDSVQVIQGSDEAVQVKFLKLGSVQLVAEILQSCDVLRDTLRVSVSSENIQLRIEGRKSICAGDVTVLTASAGFENYSWNTGDITPSITVFQAGKYIVTAVSACGGIYKDSATVIAVNPPPVISFRDTSACLTTSLSLSALPGFVSYRWSSSLRPPANERTITITIRQNERLYIEAIDSLGCVAKDSVFVTALQPASFSLGGDTSICANDSLRLQAPQWLTSVRWSTGAMGNEIVVRNTGLYIATGIDSSGCEIMDSMRINAVFPVPVLALGNSGPVCSNDPVSLDAGVHDAYRWSDGSTGRFLTVTNPGGYSVQVWNNQGCHTIDSILITAIHPLPANFLNPVDSICNYESLRLQPNRAFRTYLWNTGATTPSILVSQPGLYRLTVSDANGCRGTDSANIIQKQCLEGVFIPNAFTPNNDGKNDIFNPLLFLQVEYYEFWVFNRWGELMFHSTSIGNGWDGTFNGKQMPSGNFVWKCAYRETGKSTEVLKGNVVLIR